MRRMSDGTRWTRVYRGGWLGSGMRTVLWLLVAVGLPVTFVVTVARVTGDGADAQTVSALWVAAAWAVFLVWRLARYGTWSSADGLRVDRLLRWDRIPWSRVRSFTVEPTSPVLGWQLRRTVLETVSGRRIVLPGTNALLVRILAADSPEMARHRLERERRYFLSRDLPRRRPRTPLSEDVIDLRTRPGTRSGPRHAGRR